MIQRLDPTPIREQPTTEDILDSMVDMLAALRDAVKRDRLAREAQDAAILDRLHEMTDRGPQWMTLVEAAEYLRVTPRTIYNLIDRGSITRYGAAMSPRFRKDDLDAFIEHANTNDR